MDDRQIKKIKAIGNFINFYKGFFFISSVATIIIALLIKSLFNEDKFFINQFIQNWNKKPITEINFSANDCPTEYEQSDLGFWPMAHNLCDCTESYFFKRANNKKVIKPYPCTYMLQFMGCRDSEEESKRINIRRWKGRKVCVKRQNETYIQNLLNKNEDLCDCKLNDSLNKNICIKSSKDCPIKNSELMLKAEQQLKSQKFEINLIEENLNLNKSRDNFLEKNNKFKKIRQDELRNYTTFDDIEMLYNKNFNVTYNNEILKNNAISDLIIIEHYPCLIPNNYDKVNEADHLFEYILDNVDLIKNNTNKMKRQISPSDDNKLSTYPSILPNLHLQSLDNKECFFYENSYFDRRHYVLDAITFDQFLLHDINSNAFNYSNMSLIYEDMSRIENFTPTTTLFLISNPFYGWNIKICKEDPQFRMDNILSLYDSASQNINLVVLIKIICFIYLTLNGIFEKIFEEYHFAMYTRKMNNLNKNNYQMIFDILYYLIKIVSLCCLIQICFTLKNLTQFHFLHIVRNDCVDENSTKIFSYLYDICEEKFIYCVFILTFNALEFIFFTIIFKNSYELKLIL